MLQIADQRAGFAPIRVCGIEGFTPDALQHALAAGGRFVFFEYTISLVFLTLRRPSAVYFLRTGDWAWWRGLPYCLVSLFLGWWGLPWGIIYAPMTMILNLSGGRDVTVQLSELLCGAGNAAPPPTGDTLVKLDLSGKIGQ